MDIILVHEFSGLKRRRARLLLNHNGRLVYTTVRKGDSESVDVLYPFRGGYLQLFCSWEDEVEGRLRGVDEAAIEAHIDAMISQLKAAVEAGEDDAMVQLFPNVAAIRAVGRLPEVEPCLAEIRAARERIRERSEIDRKVREAEEEARAEAGVVDACQRIARGERVDSEELESALKRLSIEVHPRTIGMLRRRLSWIAQGRAAYNGGRPISDNVFSLYRKAQQVAQEQGYGRDMGAAA